MQRYKDHEDMNEAVGRIYTGRGGEISSFVYHHALEFVKAYNGGEVVRSFHQENISGNGGKIEFVFYDNRQSQLLVEFSDDGIKLDYMDIDLPSDMARRVLYPATIKIVIDFIDSIITAPVH